MNSKMERVYTIVLLVWPIISVTWGAEICCESSGDCFTDDLPFDGLNWPLPECHNVTFELWRKDMDGARVISRGNTPPEFNRNDDTVYLVHGWTSGGYWMYDLKDEFLKSSITYNIVVVDWEEGADPVYYPQAASNVRVTGSEIADINLQLDPVFSWCVGHSLGAQSCGHTGKAGGLLDRISGLDPAGPNFDSPECDVEPEICRLHPSDAPQVDASHTQSRISGTMNLVGDLDFFPNGGIDQPGCDGQLPECGHNIAQDYFKESINSDCFVTTHHQCTDPTSLPDSCIICEPLECPNMGASASFGEGIYYLETNAESPYCQG